MKRRHFVKLLAGLSILSSTSPAWGRRMFGIWGAISGCSGNDIGTPGAQGFGVGVCPAGNLPSGFTGMTGYTDPANDNYGNYYYDTGAYASGDRPIMCYVPKFYYKVGTGSNGLSVNVIDVKNACYYATTAAANAAGYALHRAFIDGNSEKAGVFVDKYMVSRVALGTGYVASSVKNGLPLSSGATHNPFADCTGGSNYYHSLVDLAHRRDGSNGAVNSSSIFGCCSQFIRSALAILSMAHGQASSATTYCAWYHATYNFPKGCNNNARSDTDDTSVIWESDGYSNCGKTGSAGYGGGTGNLFAKSTHNGQNCGVADLNGLMYEVSIGITCIAGGKTITAATQANPCQITATGHGWSTGQIIQITSVVGMTQLNDKLYAITRVDDNNFTLNGIDSTGYTAYTSGGTATGGTFYVAKQATSLKSFTNGNSGATDHWGATGVAAMMDSFVPAFAAAGGGFTQRFGSGSNQVLSEATSGAGWTLAGLGFPKDSNGMSSGGTNLFGTDYYYQYIRNELCLLASLYWNNWSAAGVWGAYWSDLRTYSAVYVGGRLACYPV